MTEEEVQRRARACRGQLLPGTRNPVSARRVEAIVAAAIRDAADAEANAEANAEARLAFEFGVMMPRDQFEALLRGAPSETAPPGGNARAADEPPDDPLILDGPTSYNARD